MELDLKKNYTKTVEDKLAEEILKGSIEKVIKFSVSRCVKN